jgi:hypothetical protein
MAVNWVPYAFTTSIVDTATNTTLGTATRLNFPSLTITIPETGSRSFLSVILRIGWRDHSTGGVTNDVTGVRMGIQLGAAAAADTDRSFTQAGTAAHPWDEFTLDCTSYFNTNFGAGTTQTCVASLAVSQTAAANIGGNITAVLEITYAFDATVGTTRLRAIPIPIGSHSTTFTAALVEVGSDGTNGPGTSQIPNLTSLIKEASPSIVHSHIFAETCDTSVSAVDLVPEWQIDAAAALTRNVIGNATASTTLGWYRDILPYDTATFLPNATHTLKFRDTTTTARYCSMGATLWVLYTFDASSTTRQLNVARVAIQQSGDTFVTQTAGPTSTATADALEYYFDLNIQEPGTITLERAAAVIDYVNCVGGANMSFSAGSQAFRAYVASASGGSTPDVCQIVHRCDYGSGWSLARGDNHLALRMSTNVATSPRNFIGHAYAWILYSSDVPAAGVEVGTRPLSFHGASYGTTPTYFQDIAAASQIAPSFQNSIWSLSSFVVDGYARQTATAYTQQLMLLLGGGEWDGAGWMQTPAYRQPKALMCSRRWAATVTHWFSRHWLASGKLAPQTAHRAVLSQAVINNAAFNCLQSLVYRPTIHNISFTVAGTVTVNGSAAPNGVGVDVFAYDGATFNIEHLTTTFIAGGAGGFTCQVPDNTRTYYCTYDDGAGNVGASSLVHPGVPGASSFNITIGGASSDVIITSFPAVTSSANTGSFQFTATGAVEYSLDGGAYAAAASPQGFGPLSVGSHTMDFRLASNHAVHQSFTWTYSPGSSDVTPPAQTVISPAANSSFGADYASAKDVPAIVDVIDASSAIAFVTVHVKFSDRPAAELVYAGTGAPIGFVAPYAGYSTIVGTGLATVGFRLSIRRDGGWPKSADGAPILAAFTYHAVDAAGNVL